jgi:uncharacterized membrane protein
VEDSAKDQEAASVEEAADSEAGERAVAGRNEKMRPADFLQKLDDAAIAEAIQAAERQTSGEIRVFVTSRNVRGDSVVKQAAARFEKLGMTATRDRNAVLLYFVPRAHQFAIIGDRGIHEKCGETFWQDVALNIHEKFMTGHFTDAIVGAIKTTGEVLARYFPRSSDDRNELPNELEQD